METFIYLTTDVDEAIEILNGRHYNARDGKILINGKTFPIENLSISVGRDIQKRLGLNFNPMSFISGEMGSRETSKLVGKLVRERLFVATCDDVVSQSFPTKYNGYLGRDNGGIFY